MTRIVDGDSLHVAKRSWLNFLRKSKPFPVRLYAIDAPELSQPYGTEARDAMRKLANGTFRMKVMNVDRYGRAVGVVYRWRRKKSLNHRIVEAGLAYSYQRYGKLDGIEEAEARARKRRRGVWKSGGSQTRPWDHRLGRGSNSRHEARRKKRWWLRVAVILIALVAAAAGLQWLWASWGDAFMSIYGG